jgi:hypothetical protein
MELPLSAPVPASYTMQWFVKDTWVNLHERLEQLQLPTIHWQADVYLIERIHGEAIVSVLYVNG